MDFDKLFPGHFTRGDAVFVEEGLFAIQLAYKDGDTYVLTDEGKKRSGQTNTNQTVVESTPKKRGRKPAVQTDVDLDDLDI